MSSKLGAKAKKKLSVKLASIIYSILSTVLFVAAVIIVLSYLLNAPFMYGKNQLIPVALTTSICFLFLGLLLFIYDGTNSVPLKYFVSDSIESSLTRYFVPLIISSILITTRINASFLLKANPALIASAMLIFFIFLCILFIRLSAGRLIALKQQADSRLRASNQQLRASDQQLRASEDKLRIIIDTSPIGICTVDPLGNFVMTNIAYERMVGYSKEELRDLSFFDVTHPDSRPKNKKLYQDMFSLKTKGFFMEKKYIRKDGAMINVTVHVTGIMDAGGNVQFGTAFVEDITKRKQVEDDKKSMQKQLIISSKLALIGELAAGVAHEINNPLAIINGFGDMISTSLNQRGVHSSELQTFIDKQKDCVTIIKNIVDGLRIYARIDASDRKRFNTNDIVRGSVDLIQNVYEKSHNTIIETSLEQNKLIIEGHKGKFQQIIMNLLSNAKDAMQKNNGGTVTVSTYGDEKNVVISVSDQGEGIKEEYKNKIFETFFTTKDVGEGTGMGLSIVLSLVKEMDGIIDLESVEGKGAKFIITLPRFEAMESSTISINSEIEFKPLHGRVLVVDDEDCLREILREHLNDFGLEVEEAANGVIALQKLKTSHFDVVITDIKMPNMKGDELIKKMSEIGYLDKTKILIITGGIEEKIFEKDNDLRDIEIGIIDKPFDREIIYKNIKNALT